MDKSILFYKIIILLFILVLIYLINYNKNNFQVINKRQYNQINNKINNKQIDVAILYFGLTRSTKKVYDSHIQNIFDILDKNNLSYKKFMHTWKINNNKQRVWQNIINKEIDYEEYKLLNPDFYKIDSQDEFLSNLNMDNYFYKDVWNTIGHSENGEWLPELVQNHLCALESQKRCLEMVEDFMKKNNINIKYFIFIRPDVMIYDNLPVKIILKNNNKIYIPNDNNYEGLNDRFAITNYKNACLYGKRINEIAEFRKNNGRIVSEKYVKFIINKYKMNLDFIKFDFDIVRP